MNIINQKVLHKAFGQGIVIEQSNDRIRVQFSSKTTAFKYPDVFHSFISAVDPAVQQSILDEEAEILRQTKEAEEAKRKAEKQKAAEEIQNRASAEMPFRISGKPMTYFVFQGSSYDRESKGGYIWAPCKTKDGKHLHHWDRMLEVRTGDVILHGVNGYVQAISTAKGECYDCIQPIELRQEDAWELDGRKIDCDYAYINMPIKTAAYSDAIIKFSPSKYSPFKSDGSGGNMGYLYDLNYDLAKFFIRESVKRNTYLAELDFIRPFLSD